MSTSKFPFHLRSNSLPSKNHPLTEGFEEQLSRLRESKSTSSSVSYKVSALKDLHDSVDDLLHFPLVQQALSNEYYSKCIEESLGRSIRLLDVCGTTRDVFSQMKECVQGLESSLWRKRCGESRCLENEVGEYMISRKRLNKVIFKCFRDMKRTEKKSTSTIPSVDKDSNLFAALCILKEVEEISLLVFESILSFICRPKARTAGWCVVSKLVQSRRVSCEGLGAANEVEKMDARLIALIGKKSNHVEVRNVLMGLQDIKCSVQEVEEELECVFRRMIKVRVSLLNTLNH